MWLLTFFVFVFDEITLVIDVTIAAVVAVNYNSLALKLLALLFNFAYDVTLLQDGLFCD